VTSTSEQVGQLGLRVDGPAGRLNACSISATIEHLIRVSERPMSCKAVIEMNERRLGLARRTWQEEEE
jgi:hypothetical protein